MDAEEARTIGFALWRVRDGRGKSLRVVAGLAGMSKDTLNRIEHGLLSPTLSQIHALADALQVSTSELTRLPVPAPANGHTDSTIEAVRLALNGIDVGHPGGLVLPVAVLRDRVAQLQEMRRRCQFTEVATDLVGLIRDLHTTLATGTNRGELFELVVYLHVQVTSMWLQDAGAPIDLRREVASLTRCISREHGENITLAMAALATTRQLMSTRQFDLAQAALDALTMPGATAETAGLVGGLTMRHAAVAAADNRPGDAAAALEAAAELAARFGETGEHNPLGFAFGPTDVGFRRAALALAAGEPDRAVSIAEGLQPQRHPFMTRQAAHWTNYGQALARLRGRHDDAVRALRHAELMSPHHVLRNPFVRDTLAVLLRRSRRGSPADQELRGMARRASLPV
ncbi:MAG: helix-turn-helix domain-containing protein [Pseudonocardiaceae bacterium]